MSTLPDVATVAARLEAQRLRIFQVMGVCSLASMAGQSVPSADAIGRLTQHFGQDVWSALEGAYETLNDIVSELDPAQILKPGEGRSPLPACGYSDDTALRILALLASVKPLAGSDGQDETFYRGRSIVERIAISAKGTDSPSIQLGIEHCADVLRFLAYVEPFEPGTWWEDPPNSPSHTVGLQIVLRAMADSLQDVKS